MNEFSKNVKISIPQELKEFSSVFTVSKRKKEQRNVVIRIFFFVKRASKKMSNVKCLFIVVMHLATQASS